MDRKTLLIGLDGATFTLLDPLMDQGVMPFLKSFLAGGARAALRTIVPALTPPGVDFAADRAHPWAARHF